MMAIGGAGWLRLPGRLWWRVSCGQDTDFDEVVGEDPVSAPGPDAVDAGEFGAVPAVASLEVVDPSFGLRGQQQRDQAQAAVPRIRGELADIAEAALSHAFAGGESFMVAAERAYAPVRQCVHANSLRLSGAMA